MPTFRARLGTWGEGLAVRFLQDKGYLLVATNYRCTYGEVDIVARDGEELVFVEVRTRHGGSFGSPEESLSKAKIQRLLKTCQEYLRSTSGEGTEWRIDLVSIRVGPGRQVQSIQHLPHAIQL